MPFSRSFNSTHALMAAAAAAGAPPVSTADIEKARAVATALMTVYVLVPFALSRALTPACPERRPRRTLFWWLGFSAMTHLIHESLFLYQCFFVSGPAGPATTNSWLPDGVHFLGRADRIHGAHQGGPGSVWSLMWMDYARADRRWAGSDPLLISLQMALVLLEATLGLSTLWNLWKNGGVLTPAAAFKVVVISVFELLGNWMVFVPELLTGAPNLDLADPERFWFYLVVMNSLWFIFPAMSLWQSYGVLVDETVDDGRPRVRVGASSVGDDEKKLALGASAPTLR